MANTRTEKDSLGELEVPADAYYGVQTQRAVQNFPISGRPMPPRFIHALGLVKKACAEVNVELGELDKERGDIIAQVAQEVADGALDAHFPIDIFQTGSGTSTNMNANEVIANRVAEVRGQPRGDYGFVHPNDHVNMGQSSNDIIPTTLHVAVALAVHDDVLPGLTTLAESLRAKAAEFDDVVKVGRTHLMDAVPVTAGQEIGAWATSIERAAARIEAALDDVLELAQGGTAVGTGLNAHPDFGAKVAEKLATTTGLHFREAEDHFEAQASRDAVTHLSGALNTAATSLVKVANDLRLLGSGPRTGIAEYRLPSLQPGSSIMPGKVNPVIPEALVQVGLQVSANHTAVTMANQWGQLQLNVTLPLLAKNLLESCTLLANGATVLAEKCIDGLEVDADRADELVRKSFILVTKLNPEIGYEKAAEVAKKAFKERKDVIDVVVEMGLMDRARAEEVLDPATMV